MFSRVLKVLSISVGVIVTGLGLYLVFPPLSSLSAVDPINQPSTDSVNEHACKSDAIYVTERTREIHQGEGYEFVVDDKCAGLQKQLVDAADMNDLDAARRLINDGANPQTADWSRFEPRLPLHVAAYDSPNVVEILVQNGADVNKESCCCAACSSPLAIAIEHNQEETVRVLLEHGADPDYRPSYSDGDRFSPFELAMKSENPEIVRLVGDACRKSLSCRIRLRTQTLLSVIKG